MPTNDSIALHGWTSVVRDHQAILSGKPNINEPSTLLVNDITFPSDEVVAKVRKHAEEKLPAPTFNHSMRVFYFATAILDQQFPDLAKSLSRSTLALTALLHDIGTTHENLHATQMSFEFYGGFLALDLVGQKLGAPQSQAEAVAEAIIRHQDLGSTGTITFLGQLIQLATVYDNMGDNPGLIHSDTKVDVNKAFPRLGWSKCFSATIREEVGLKPWAHTTHLGEAFPRGVENNKLMSEFEN
ncbi:hypothetical protein J7T55_010048 [Diaporthe amygdali]|uniref:uncharacterized protein n=1 Tax=Phomopsis amygdali TaxID=1214568 RepID=UPI0022FED8CF|nr:uncharacterized protein J7T55_010048 [Diaporthe amygdali]KAJ0113804.1 hypothetical protein J7T55_010048 [Diaporthe amygdali]